MQSWVNTHSKESFNLFLMSATNCSKPKRTTSINYSKLKRTGPAVLRSSSTPAILAWRKHLSGSLPFFGYITTFSCSFALLCIPYPLILLRYVNNNSAKFVQKFQPEISAKIGKIIKNYLNSAMGQVEAELMID